MAKLLGVAGSDADGLYTPLIVMRWRETRMALQVDEAEEVAMVDRALSQPLPPNHSFNDCAEAHFSLDGKKIVLLSADGLLLSQERQRVAEPASGRAAPHRRFTHTAGMNVRTILSDPGYPELKSYILNHTGLGYYSDKDEDLAARLSRRLTLRGVGACGVYLRKLTYDRAEMEGLIGELTIGETYFFRQREHFDLLRERVIPDLLERNQSSRCCLRIWSAGCATGAEPYSIALVLRREFASRIEGWDVSILATDINVDFLARAAHGVFGPIGRCAKRRKRSRRPVSCTTANSGCFVPHTARELRSSITTWRALRRFRKSTHGRSI